MSVLASDALNLLPNHTPPLLQITIKEKTMTPTHNLQNLTYAHHSS